MLRVHVCNLLPVRYTLSSSAEVGGRESSPGAEEKMEAG